ncbi:MAG: hypothetical protein ACREV6_12835 [Clostridium sp.]|uniref:hypothetical protein n=1 Tax=Clostridium sp. TaxID=1506 RepID=UPI003D6D644D
MQYRLLILGKVVDYMNIVFAEAIDTEFFWLLTPIGKICFGIMDMMLMLGFADVMRN